MRKSDPAFMLYQRDDVEKRLGHREKVGYIRCQGVRSALSSVAPSLQRMLAAHVPMPFSSS